MSAPKYILDAQNQTANLDLFVGGSFVTAYSFNSGNVTLSARASVDVVTLEEWREIMESILFFQKSIKDQLTIPSYSHVVFELEVARFNGTVTLKQDIDGEEMIDVSYDYSTKEFTFQPRLQRVLNMREFAYFCEALQLILTEAEKTD